MDFHIAPEALAQIEAGALIVGGFKGEAPAGLTGTLAEWVACLMAELAAAERRL